MKLPQIIPGTPVALALLFVTVLSPSLGQTQSPAAPPPTPPATEEEKAVLLDPFVISTKQDKGYYSEQTLSGARYNKNIHDIPAAVTIINRELLEDLGAYDMLEPMKYVVSGVTLNQPDADDWNIRGFRTRGGFRNGRRSAFGGFASSTWDVERLEVIKGPAAMMTGVNSSAIGGTVNYISAKPTEDYRSWISATVAEYDEWRLHAQSSGPIRQFGNTKLLYRATLGKWDRGFDKDFAYWDEDFFGGSISAKFGPSTILTVDYTHLKRDSYATDNDLTDPVAYAAGKFRLRNDIPRARKMNLNGPAGYMHLTNEYIEFDFTHKFSPHLAMRLGYQYTVELQDWQFVTPQGYQAGSIYVANRRGSYSKLSGRSNQAQLDLISAFRIGPVKNELAGGFDYDLSNTQQHEFNQWNMPAIDIRNPDFSRDVATVDNARKDGPFLFQNERQRRIGTTYSYYIQENLSFWKDRVTLIGGFRWLDSFNTTHRVTNNTSSSSNPRDIRVYRHGIILKPMRNVSIYAVDASNYFPASGQIANPGTPFQYTFPDSNGEILEFGVKYNFFNGKIYGAVANFDLARTNVRSSRIVTFPDGSVQVIEAHLDTTTKGWEFDLGSRIDIPYGTLDLVATYYDALSLTPNNVPAYNAPTYIASGTAKVSINRGAFKGLTLGGSIRNESSVYMTRIVTNHRPMTGAVFLGYRYNEHISGNLNIDNVTDEQYVISGGPIWGDGALGRRFRLSLKYTF